MNFVSCTDTAKLIRKALKARFPSQKFSVRSDQYSGGASIDVSWTDGPTEKLVESIVGRFAGSTFDGMQDLKEYHHSEVTTELRMLAKRAKVELPGDPVHFGADFVFTRRKFTPSFLERVIAEIGERFHTPDRPTVDDFEQGRAYNTHVLSGCSASDQYWSWQATIHRAANDRTVLAA